jgi:hypothetical protein
VASTFTTPNQITMKTKIAILSLSLFYFVSSGFKTEPEKDLLNKSKPGNSKFELARTSKSISIFTRWIPATETRQTRQLKAEFYIDCFVKDVVAVLEDESTYTCWMKAAKSYYRLKTVNENQWYSYVQFSIPWPLNNQDCILKYNILENPENGQVKISLKSEPSYMQTHKGVERISHMEAMWIITQIEPSKTHVEYLVYSKQEPKFPTWITDPLIQKNLLKTMDALRSVVINANQ